MNNIQVRLFEHPGNVKLRLSGLDVLHMGNRIYSQEINTRTHFIFTEESNAVVEILTEDFKQTNDDLIIILEELPCDVFTLVKQAYTAAGNQMSPKNLTIIEIENSKIKGLNKTMGIYDNQIHYTNIFPLKASSLNDYFENRQAFNM